MLAVQRKVDHVAKSNGRQTPRNLSVFLTGHKIRDRSVQWAATDFRHGIRSIQLTVARKMNAVRKHATKISRFIFQRVEVTLNGDRPENYFKKRAT